MPAVTPILASHRVEAKPPAERVAQVSDPPRRKPHSTPSHGIGLRPDQKEVSIPIFADPRERPAPGWVSFGIDGRFAYPDGGAVIDTETKKVVARIPTSEKLVEIDFRGGRPVAAGQR